MLSANLRISANSAAIFASLSLSVSAGYYCKTVSSCLLIIFPTAMLLQVNSSQMRPISEGLMWCFFCLRLSVSSWSHCRSLPGAFPLLTLPKYAAMPNALIRYLTRRDICNYGQSLNNGPFSFWFKVWFNFEALQAQHSCRIWCGSCHHMLQ